MLRFLFVLALCAVCCFARPSGGEQAKGQDTCGYETCNLGKDGYLNVHIVPHTHDDVGWLKTVDQYFYGANNSIQTAGVQYILDSVIASLLEDPSRRFIYVEMAFFYRWWNQQTSDMQDKVKQLVNEGRLEFILGGWCMNDEATTHYTAIIDQHTTGFRFLNDTFGQCGRPRVAWQIDPFGHSREQASLFAQMYFDGLFFARNDFQDYDKRHTDKTLEMMWQGSPTNLGAAANLFTGVLFDSSYGPPGGFCFDPYCDDQPIMDDPRLHDFNVDERINAFIAHVTRQSQSYATNHIMLTMGSDFNYQNARQWFKNLDKLIFHVNARQTNGSKVNAFYSTPSCYTYGLNKAGLTWTSKQDDFFPYASDEHSFWTGYFTSRPAFKRYVRETNGLFQAAKTLHAITKLGSSGGTDLKLKAARESMGVVQHHDAVSGTEKQHVAYDYAIRVAQAAANSQDVINAAYQRLMPRMSTIPPDQVFCNYLNITQCAYTEQNKQYTVTVLNPFSRYRTAYVRIPVVSKSLVVKDPNGNMAQAQYFPVSAATMAIAGRQSNATGELVFRADLPPLGAATYLVQASSDLTQKLRQYSRMTYDKSSIKGKADFTVTTQFYDVVFTDGQIASIKNVKSGVTQKVSQSLQYYLGQAGNNSDAKFRASGAYVFRPASSKAVPVSMTSSQAYTGDMMTEVRQVFSPWLSQVWRFYDDQPYIELEWTVGPIAVKDNAGKEVIARFDTDMATASLFYTDANGREMLQRKRDYRATWPLALNESVAGNYYPVNSRIFLRDEKMGTQFTVMTDRSQGGSSLKDGSVELMVHRRLLDDDGFGVGEALNEPGVDGNGLVVRGKLFLALDSIANSAHIHREVAQQVFASPVVSFSNFNLYDPSSFWLNFTTLTRPLPGNVNLLTFENVDGDSNLLRLENFYENNEDAQFSSQATVQIGDMFKALTISQATELTLGANQLKSEAQRLPWQYKGQKPTAPKPKPSRPSRDPLETTLDPMQIRTFKVM